MKNIASCKNLRVAFDVLKIDATENSPVALSRNLNYQITNQTVVQMYNPAIGVKA